VIPGHYMLCWKSLTEYIIFSLIIKAYLSWDNSWNIANDNEIS
jgi:hypothetical protein